MTRLSVRDEPTIEAIHALISSIGGDPTTFDGRMIAELIQTSLKLVKDNQDTGQLKLLNSTLKEMRYAYRVFNRYIGKRKIAIFGSARTPEDDPRYIAARDFSRGIARRGWMSITGAGDGIMKAGHEGPKREASFGLSIRLPFETTANEVIEGDPKLINFRYFFTRKLMFLSHADAIAIFPGGFGTQDETFESLTLVQTGKSNIVPIVLLEDDEGVYWRHWDNYVRKNLLEGGMISDEDLGIFYIAATIDDAIEHVLGFYRVYHSSRYVREQLVIRMTRPLTREQVELLNDEFSGLVKSGAIMQSEALEDEEDHLDLPRLVFHHHRRNYGRLRGLIDRINQFDAGSASGAPDEAQQT